MIHRLTLLLLLVFAVQSTQAQNGKSQRLYQKAQLEVRNRNFSEAKELYQKAIKADPKYGDPYLKLASLYNIFRNKDSALLYYEGYATAVPVERINAKIWTQIARLNYELGRYRKARDVMFNLRKFGSWTEDMIRLDENVNFSIRSIEKGAEVDLVELPPAINRYQLQYFPVLTIDQNTLLFTKRTKNDRQSDEDIFISYKIDGNWTEAVSIADNINTPFNEGACTISADGRTLIFTSCDGARQSYGSCDLYITYREGDEWTDPENLGPNVNSRKWDSQPSLSADGRTLYFASDRGGGYGKRDIWYSKFKYGQWTRPKNAGQKVNSVFDETTPFIHANNKTLFYSSTGFENLGGFDLFVSKKDEDSVWSYPVNLGFPINTYHDELSMFINSTGDKAYFSKEETNLGKLNKSKIVEFPVALDTIIDRATYVTGIITDALTGEPLGAELEMTNMTLDSEVFITSSDSVTGKYFLVLNEQTEYSVFITRTGYLFEDLKFTPQSHDLLAPDTLNLVLNPMRTGVSVVLENIYFEFDDYRLNDKSIVELQNIVKYLTKNEALEFMIKGHTDSAGTKAYNIALSEKRAKAVYEYLLEKGISLDRLQFSGLGDSQPLDPNRPEINRRIEFQLQNAPF